MQASPLRYIAVALASGAALTLALLPSAQSQMRAMASPSFVPVGVSSSGTSSTAWFHDPSTSRAIACQTTASTPGPSGIHCVAVKLPQEGS
jgi:hypothetical protein